MHITQGIKELEKIFKNHPIDQVHQRSHEVLHKISENKHNLSFMFKWFMENHYEETRQFSITGDFIIPLHESNAFTLDCGLFSPYNTNYSYATMHNHDDVELSTINMFGSGYNSLIFYEGFKLSEDRSVNIELNTYKRHSLENIEYIKPNVAHTVFYPKDLTITLTLWSSSRSIGNSFSDIWYRYNKRNRSKQRKKQLHHKYGVKNLSYVLQDWFYPSEGKIYKTPYYQQVKSGTNFFNNFLVKLQLINFDENDLVENYFSQTKLSEKEEVVLNRFLKNEKLELNHEGDIMVTPKRNVHISEYKKCFPKFDFTLT